MICKPGWSPNTRFSSAQVTPKEYLFFFLMNEGLLLTIFKWFFPVNFGPLLCKNLYAGTWLFCLVKENLWFINRLRSLPPHAHAHSPTIHEWTVPFVSEKLLITCSTKALKATGFSQCNKPVREKSASCVLTLHSISACFLLISCSWTCCSLFRSVSVCTLFSSLHLSCSARRSWLLRDWFC